MISPPTLTPPSLSRALSRALSRSLALLPNLSLCIPCLTQCDWSGVHHQQAEQFPPKSLLNKLVPTTIAVRLCSVNCTTLHSLLHGRKKKSKNTRTPHTSPPPAPTHTKRLFLSLQRARSRIIVCLTCAQCGLHCKIFDDTVRLDCTGATAGRLAELPVETNKQTLVSVYLNNNAKPRKETVADEAPPSRVFPRRCPSTMLTCAASENWRTDTLMTSSARSRRYEKHFKGDGMYEVLPSSRQQPSRAHV